MFYQYEPNVKATIAFLRLLGVKVNNATVDETLQNHPDWPSLLCISDALIKWKIPNGAGQIGNTNVDQVPTPFIAHTNDKENPLAIVSQVNEDKVIFYQKNYKRLSLESRETFCKKWDGVYLIAEPNEHSGEPHYERKHKSQLLVSLLPVTAFVIFFFATAFVLLTNIKSALAISPLYSRGIMLQYLISIAGLLLSASLLWYETDKNNPLLNKVCTGIAKGNCNAILTSKAAKIFRWLSWSEVGFFYYAGSLLCMLFAGRNIPPFVSLIALFNILAVPYPLYSLYYQWRIAKQWCVLCLAVQATLMLGIINVVVTQLYGTSSKISLLVLTQSFLFYLLPALAWLSIKPFMLKLQESKNTKRDYLRIKFNTEIFETLLRKQKQVTISSDGLGIDIGNPAAKNILIKVCNPYCGPCAKAHLEIEKLLEEIPDLKVKIILASTNSEDDIRSKPAKHLLAIFEIKDESIVRKALNDWYLADKKNYEEFARKYPLNGEIKRQEERIEAMDRWYKKMKIEYTPTLFINGYQLPQTYTINDLRYFLLE
jgi:thiol-disulfide isomerase/thioredoxin